MKKIQNILVDIHGGLSPANGEEPTKFVLGDFSVEKLKENGMYQINDTLLDTKNSPEYWIGPYKIINPYYRGNRLESSLGLYWLGVHMGSCLGVIAVCQGVNMMKRV